MLHHNLYTSYCKNCKRNLCTFCLKSHCNNNNFHNAIEYKNLIGNKNEIKNEINKFKNKIETFKSDVKKIIDILNAIIKKANIYLEVNNSLLNNYYPNIKIFKFYKRSQKYHFNERYRSNN